MRGSLSILRMLLLLAAAACLSPARAELTVLVGEPFGAFGTMMPNGHIAVYLNRVCADGPLHVRMCRAGEPAGVAVARLDAIGAVDWVASPIMPFLYATDDPHAVLATTDEASVLALREQYRAGHLEALLPAGAERTKANADWWEIAGAAYSRRLWGYRIATSRAQDEALVAMLNERANHHVYSVVHRNCADFAAEVVNFYYPGSVHRNHVADMGIMSPKQVAHCVYQYGEAHPEAGLQVIEVPQVAGSLRRSRPARGGAEGFLKTKRYLLTLCLVQPEVVVGLLAAYLEGGRWDMGRAAQVMSPESVAAAEYEGTTLAQAGR